VNSESAEPAEALSRLSLNQATIPGWTVREAAEGSARAGLGWIGLWRDRVAETGLRASAAAVRDAGLGVSSLCRGGWFGAPDRAGLEARMEDNRRAVEEAAALGASCLVLVCGPAPDRDLERGRRVVSEGIAELVPYAAERGVRLAVEPLHPMYCGDRSVVVTLGQALAMAAQAGPGVGVAIDTYHVWWDPEVWAGVAAAAGRIIGFHVNDWLVPTPDMLNGRGLMGDGVIELRRLRRAVDAAGYQGPIEVEIFNRELWSLLPEQALALIAERYLAHVAEPAATSHLPR
jgi:sugar phosphate isomerase/epimerase